MKGVIVRWGSNQCKPEGGGGGSFKKKKRLEMAATKTGPPKRLNLTSEIQ